MKLLQIMAPGQVEWREAPVPEPGPGEVLVRIEGVTTCPHWDLHIVGGVPMFPGQPIPYPYTPGQPGHEGTGEVVALGTDVTELAVGARVACWRDPGHHRQGCYAQYVPMAVENVIEVPPGLAPEEIAPLELAMCVQCSFDRLNGMGAVLGKCFAVGGLGPAGLVAVQMARAYGARDVIGIDPLPDRRQLALELGADSVISPDDPALSGESSASAFDAAIDCTGLKVVIESLLDHTRDAVAIFGVLRERVEFTTRHYFSGVGLLGYGPVYTREAAMRALQLVNDGSLRLAPFVTHTLPFTRYLEGIELLRNRQAIKVCFRPWQ